MEITLDITDDVGLIRFDDGKKNAFTLDGIKNLTGAFDEAEANAKAIVLTGRPGSFCAGFDLATMMGCIGKTSPGFARRESIESAGVARLYSRASGGGS